MILARLEPDAESYIDSEMMNRLVIILESFQGNMDSFEAKMKNRPHVVILGAGASVAAIPAGDANGKKDIVVCI